MSRKHLVRKCEKTTDEGQHTVIRRCWTKLLMQRKKVQNRRKFWFLSKDGYRMAEWLRISTATPTQSLALESKTISVGNILGRDQKLTQAETHARHFKQQSHCVVNI